MQQEIFGPVVCVVPFDTEPEVRRTESHTYIGLQRGPPLVHGHIHVTSFTYTNLGWLGSRVVSVLDSGAVRQIAVATLSCNSLRQTVRTHRASVHQAAKLVAALLRVVEVTAGLAESTAGFMTHATCRLIAKNRDQLRNPTLCNRVWATFTFFMGHDHSSPRIKSQGHRSRTIASVPVGLYSVVVDQLPSSRALNT